MSQGKLFVISGASGVGKSTVLKLVMENRKDLRFSVSATTRPPRPDEKDGVNYYFVTKRRFEDMIAANAFVEYNAHMENFYGTPRDQLEEKLRTGNVILDIEPNGAFTVRAERPDAVLIFIAPPSMEELEHRLRTRGDTSPAQVQLPVEAARRAMEARGRDDYIVVNEQVKTCAEEILKIIADKAV